jgi:hypothetical protein
MINQPIDHRRGNLIVGENATPLRKRPHTLKELRRLDNITNTSPGSSGIVKAAFHCMMRLIRELIPVRPFFSRFPCLRLFLVRWLFLPAAYDSSFAPRSSQRAIQSVCLKRPPNEHCFAAQDLFAFWDFR